VEFHRVIDLFLGQSGDRSIYDSISAIGIGGSLGSSLFPTGRNFLATFCGEHRPIDGKACDRNHLILALLLSLAQSLEVHPVNTVYGAGIDRLLDQFLTVAVLAHDPGPPVVRLDVKGMARYMGAMPTANAGHLIDIDTPLTKGSPQFWLQARSLDSAAQNAPEFGF
jgi:hypothetical protein